MAYDVEAIRTRVNNMIANLRKACDNEDWDTVEDICCTPLYDVDDIPQVKHTYQVTLWRVMTRTVKVEATDEDDALLQLMSTTSYCSRFSNMNDWELAEELEPDVELMED